MHECVCVYIYIYIYIYVYRERDLHETTHKTRATTQYYFSKVKSQGTGTAQAWASGDVKTWLE